MNRPLLAQKLTQIATCCRELEAVARTRPREFESRPERHRLAERDVQLIVDSAVDVNNHLILDAGRPPPQKYFETFIEVGRLGAIPAALARRLARSTGLRNRIVHQYETVDLGLLRHALPGLIRDYRLYCRGMRRLAGI